MIYTYVRVQHTGASCARWLEEGTTRPLVCRADRALRVERVNALENRIILTRLCGGELIDVYV
jgi:hypothetical protein